jgi:YVTN family beta-propeller protein
MITRRATLIGAFLVFTAGGQATAAPSGMAYASNEKDNTVSVIDLSTMKTLKTVPTGQRPRGMTLTSDGKRLVVCEGDSNSISILDTTSWMVLGVIETPDAEYVTLRKPQDNPLFVSNENNAQVTSWSLDTQKLLWRAPTGTEPEGIAVSPDGEIICNTTRPRIWRSSSTRAAAGTSPTYWCRRGRAGPPTRMTGTRSGCRQRSAAE